MRTTIGTDAAPAVALLRRVVHELIESGRDEVVELHLGDRALARRCAAPTAMPKIAFSAIGELMMRSPNSFEQRPQQQERAAVVAADVLAVDEHARIGTQRIADAGSHRFEKGRPLPVERQAGIELAGAPD